MNSKAQSKKSPWQEIWEKKGETAQQTFELQDLLAIDGYDTAVSNVSTENWLRYVGRIKKRVRISKNHNVCEVGCGAGAFIFPLYKEGINIWGIDYSDSLIRICKRIMPSGIFEVAEARAIPFSSAMFDVVISSGVFNYFEDLGYAERTIEEIKRILKPNAYAAILDINDADKKDKYESIRREKLGNEKYDRLYKNHIHLFYDKTWFEKVADRYNLLCEIEDQDMAGYENSRFRFNAFFTKKQ
jgi:ubiquinone/menaquinone biosynthesis C-methylase UbiE